MHSTKDLSPQSSHETRPKEQLTIRINKNFFINLLLVLLISLTVIQTWQLTSLRTKIAAAQKFEAKTGAVAQPASQTPAGNGGVNSLPAQVGGC
jgi:cytochrome oxidase assembly protein ShyY1